MINNITSIQNPLHFKQTKIKPKLRLGILASGIGSNFEAILLEISTGKLEAKITLLIVNNPASGAISKAKKYNVPYKIINHMDYNSRQDFDVKIVNEFKMYDTEAIIMAGWMRIATNKLIEAFPNRIVNIHPSLLPSFKGANAIEKALQKGVKITGCTVHLVEQEVDSGLILIQAAVSVDKEDTYHSLRDKIQRKEHSILPLGIKIAAEMWRYKVKDNM